MRCSRRTFQTRHWIKPLGVLWICWVLPWQGSDRHPRARHVGLRGSFSRVVLPVCGLPRIACLPWGRLFVTPSLVASWIWMTVTGRRGAPWGITRTFGACSGPGPALKRPGCLGCIGDRLRGRRAGGCRTQLGHHGHVFDRALVRFRSGCDSLLAGGQGPRCPFTGYGNQRYPRTPAVGFRLQPIWPSHQGGNPLGDLDRMAAVDLAAQGFVGPLDIWDHPDYYRGQAITDGFGEEWTILRTYFKPYACCRWAARRPGCMANSHRTGAFSR